MRRGARRQLSTTVAALLAVLAALALGACSSSHTGSSTARAQGSAAPFEGAALPGAPAPDFALSDQQGRRTSPSQLRGGVVVLAFLYTRCRACVLIAQQIRGALDTLARPVPVLVVSVDPAADTPASVRAFLAQVALAGRARYLARPAAALPAVWRAYRVRTPREGRAAFEAAAPVLLLDAQGRERVLFEEEQLTPEALAHDIRTLQGG